MGTVTNAIVGDPDTPDDHPDASLIDAATASSPHAWIGWTYDGLAFHAPTPLAPDVPDTVTNFQARAALIAAGLFTKVDGAVRASGDPTAVAAWDYANNFYRDSAFISGALAAAAGITPAQIDALFIAAAQIA